VLHGNQSGDFSTFNQFLAAEGIMQEHLRTVVVPRTDHPARTAMYPLGQGLFLLPAATVTGLRGLQSSGGRFFDVRPGVDHLCDLAWPDALSQIQWSNGVLVSVPLVDHGLCQQIPDPQPALEPPLA
jgi:hypothetical protein